MADTKKIKTEKPKKSTKKYKAPKAKVSDLMPELLLVEWI